MADDLGRWQRRLLPLMSGILIASALFFAAVSIREFQGLRDWLERDAPAAAAITWPAATDPDYDRGLAVAIDRGSYQLEHDVVAERYKQATAAVLSRLWTRFMGFLTGMILAFVGAAFVLGKLAEAPTEVKAAGSGVSAAIATSSPGLVLAALGAVLMAVSLSVTTTTSGEDRAVYFRFGGSVPAAAESRAAAPPDAALAAPAARPLTTAEIMARLPRPTAK